MQVLESRDLALGVQVGGFGVVVLAMPCGFLEIFAAPHPLAFEDPIMGDDEAFIRGLGVLIGAGTHLIGCQDYGPSGVNFKQERED